MNRGIVFLGPKGTTFSCDAYDLLAKKFGAPVLNMSSSFVSVESNKEIIPTLIGLGGGYGVIAMETLAQGKVVEPIESFANLIDYAEGVCPVSVIGAIRMEINFALIAKPGVKADDIRCVLAHDKALGACRQNLRKLGCAIESRTSNGLAVLEVKSSNKKDLAALGPVSAARNYRLSVINDRFEDGKAVTTFFLLGPAESQSKVMTINRALVIFKLEHKSGSLAKALMAFARNNISLIHIHSVYSNNRQYSFVVEAEMEESELLAFNRVIYSLKKMTEESLVFGPFGIL